MTLTSKWYSLYDISYGFVLPIIPALLIPKSSNSPNPYIQERWVCIQNLSKSDNVYVVGINTSVRESIDIKYNKKHRNIGQLDVVPTVRNNEKISITMAPKEDIWFCLPEDNIIEINILLGDTIAIIKFTEVSSLTMYNITG